MWNKSHIYSIIPSTTKEPVLQKLYKDMYSKTLINKDEILKQCSNNTEARKKRERKENERRQAEKQITK